MALRARTERGKTTSMLYNTTESNTNGWKVECADKKGSGKMR